MPRSKKQMSRAFPFRIFECRECSSKISTATKTRKRLGFLFCASWFPQQKTCMSGMVPSLREVNNWNFILFSGTDIFKLPTSMCKRNCEEKTSPHKRKVPVYIHCTKMTPACEITHCNDFSRPCEKCQNPFLPRCEHIWQVLWPQSCTSSMHVLLLLSCSASARKVLRHWFVSSMGRCFDTRTHVLVQFVANNHLRPRTAVCEHGCKTQKSGN